MTTCPYCGGRVRPGTEHQARVRAGAWTEDELDPRTTVAAGATTKTKPNPDHRLPDPLPTCKETSAVNPPEKPATPSEAAIAAATWWGQKLGHFAGNGDTDPMAVGLQLYAHALQPTDSPDAVERFIGILATAVQAELDRLHGRDYQVLTLSVDYGPEEILYEAAQKADLRSRFPIKTTMWAETDHITVSLGYQGATQLVWASDAWKADWPVCGIQHWDRREAGGNQNYHGDPFTCSRPRYHDGDCDQATPISLCTVCGRRREQGHHDLQHYAWTDDVHDFDPAPAGTRPDLPVVAW